MKVTIHKDRHRTAQWWRFLAFWLFRKDFCITRVVTFHSNCLYDLPGTYDDEDINKLFGICVGFNPHKNSGRFGWVDNSKNKTITLHSYVYDNGNRKVTNLCDVQINVPVRLVLWKFTDRYMFEVINMYVAQEVIVSKTKNWFSYYLGLYFGGNKKAPHKMTMDIRKK